MGKNRKNLGDSLTLTTYQFFIQINQSNIFDSLFVVIIFFIFCKILTGIFLIIVFVFIYAKKLMKTKKNFKKK